MIWPRSGLGRPNSGPALSAGVLWLAVTACGSGTTTDGAPSGSGGGPADARAAAAPPARLVDATAADPSVARAAEEAWSPAAAAPQDVELRLELAHVYDANGLFELARAVYGEAIALEGADEGAEALTARARYHLGCMELQLGEWEAGLAAFEAARDRIPDYPPVHWQIANILMDLDRLDEAERSYGRALELAPADPTGRYGLARVKLQRGDVGGAVSELRAVLARYPDDGWGNGLLARALARAGDPAGAEAARARSGEGTYAWADPWRSEVSTRAAGFSQEIERAKELLGAGRAEQAVALALALHGQHPDNVTVQGLLTAGWVRTGELDSARTMLERALVKQPDHYRIHMNLAIVHARAGRLEEALQGVERVLELNSQYAQGHAFAGELRSEAKDWVGAEQALSQALRQGASSLKTLMLLGKARANLGQFNAAAVTFQHAIRSYPSADSPYAYLALALADGGRFEEARTVFDELEQRNPEHGLLATGRARLAALIERAETGR